MDMPSIQLATPFSQVMVCLGWGFGSIVWMVCVSPYFTPHRLHSQRDLGDFCLNLYLLLPGCCWMDLMLLSCDICASTPHVRSRPVNAAKKDTRGGAVAVAVAVVGGAASAGGVGPRFMLTTQCLIGKWMGSWLRGSQRVVCVI